MARYGPPNGYARNGPSAMRDKGPADASSPSGNRPSIHGYACARRNPAQRPQTGTSIPASSGTSLPTPGSGKERKSTRKLCNVSESGVRNENGLRPRNGSLARAIVALALAVATSFTGTGFGTNSQGQAGSTPWIWDAQRDWSGEQVPGDAPSTPTGGVRLDIGNDIPVGRGRRNIPGPGRKPGPDLKEGQKKLLASQARKAAKILAMEKDTMENALDQSQKGRGRLSFGTDFVQLHDEPVTIPSEKSKSLLRDYAENYGLRFPEAIQEEMDQEDWNQRKLRKWKETVRGKKPLVVIIRQRHRHDSGKSNRKTFHEALLWTMREEMHVASASAAILQIQSPGQKPFKYQCAGNHEYLTESLVPMVKESG